MGTYRTWKSIRAERVAKGLIDEERLAELGKQMLAETRGYRLRNKREQTFGHTRAQVADLIGVTETLIERIERGDIEHAELATIRDYVDAIGGEVEVLAKLGDERIVIA